MPLSRRQRHDLLALTAAGITSAVFFVTPVILFHITPSKSASIQAKPQTPPASTPARVQIISTDVTAPVSTPAFRSSRAVTPAVRRSPAPRPSRVLASTRTRVPLGRRIARLLAGNGSYSVRPFPSALR